MTYESRKLLPGQEAVARITIMCDACKYCSAEFEGYGAVTLETALSESTTGAIEISGGNASEFYASAYLRIGDEIIKITIVDDDSLTIVAREQFGTTAESHSIGAAAQIIHSGEADGSCYGYPNNCSTPDSYSPTAKLPLMFPSAPMPAGSRYFSGLVYDKVDHSTAEINPGENIGSRARLSVSLIDQTHNDHGTVYYKKNRTLTGTMFGKLKARHPYFQGREIIYEEGLRDAGTLVEPEWIERRFIIDTFNLSRGTFSLVALDPLILTEGKKAKMPTASPAQLSGAISGATTTFTYINAPDYYFGPMSATIYVRIESEIIKCTVSNTSQLTIVTRGYGHTEIKDHAANATVQDTVRFADIHVVDAIVYALENYTTTPASFIGDYSDAIDLTPDAIITEYIVSSPTDVVDIINKFIFIGNLIMHFDEVKQKIVIRYVNELTISPININEDDHIKKDSVKIDANLKAQYTRFNISWAPFDLTKDTTQTNYQLSFTEINAGVESPSKMGEINERKALQLPMLTISADDTLVALTASNRIAAAADIAPEILTMTLPIKSVGETQGGVLELGSILNISTSEAQNVAGLPISKLYQVLKIDGNPFDGMKLKTRRYLALNPTDYDFVISAGNYENFVLSSVFAPTTPGQYIVFIESGAIFGGVTTDDYAFSTGTHATGVTFKFIARWQLFGMGGNGGDAGVERFDTGSNPGLPGAYGGGAFETYVDCEIDNGAGLIWAGGGGGGGESSYHFPPNTHYSGWGGGGGQGYGNSTGGISGTLGHVSNGGNQSGPGTFLGPWGGAWGEPGQNANGGSGGAAGVAINSHGNTVLITSGNSSLSIRGRRI